MLNIQKGGAYVGGLAFSPDGRCIASGGNGDIRIWDADSGADVMTIPGAHKDWVMSVAYSPDGKHLVSCGGWDPRIRVWDATTGQETMSMQTRCPWLNYVNYDHTGKYIVSDGVVKVWDTTHKYYAPGLGLVFIEELKEKTVKVELVEIN